MTIDWGSVVCEALCEGSVGRSDFVFPHSTSGNKPTSVGTSGATQGIDNAKNAEACSHFPTVPTAFEEDLGRASYRATEMPDGGDCEEASAPGERRLERRCRTCAHCRRPGLSDGYCGGVRPDLPPAYGPGHPLRRLPTDRGADCDAWASVRGSLWAAVQKGAESHETGVGSLTIYY